MLKVRALSRHFGTRAVLSRIDLALEKGEILCLLGPSGSGKTTLLRLLAGLEMPDSGEITFDGQDMQTVSPHQRRFGMMFQDYALFPHKDVYANVAFGLETQKMPAAERQQLVTQMLALVGLSGCERRRISTLSGGERQRVALARSLAPGPRLLLLDEPLGSLDRQLREHLADELRKILKKIGVTSVFVTHDQDEAFAVADKIAILQNGRLTRCASPETLYRQPRLEKVARFLGFRNIVSAERIKDLLGRMPDVPPNDFSNFEKKPAGPPKSLLIRPEGAQLADENTQIPKTCCLSGTLISRRFIGRSYLLTVELETETFYFEVPNHPLPPAVGAAVRLNLSPDALCWLFGENSGENA